MDPNATLSAIAYALLEGDTNEATERAEDLCEWLDHRGFRPKWDKHPTATRYFRDYAVNRFKQRWGL